MGSRLKLCTFDITHTLLKFRGCVGERYSKVGAMYGAERDPEQLQKAFFYNWKLMNLNYPNYGVQNNMTSYNWWGEMVHRVFTANDEKLSPDQLKSISSCLYDLYKTDACWEVIPGVKSLLEHLKAKQIILGVISNFDERLESVLSSTSLKSYFNFILASYVAKSAKPSKKIFDLALEHTSCVLPSEAIHIGDNVELDYLAAKKAGWNALLIATPALTDDLIKQVNPKDIVKDISELENIIGTQAICSDRH